MCDGNVSHRNGNTNDTSAQRKARARPITTSISPLLAPSAQPWRSLAPTRAGQSFQEHQRFSKRDRRFLPLLISFCKAACCLPSSIFRAFSADARSTVSLMTSIAAATPALGTAPSVEDAASSPEPAPTMATSPATGINCDKRIKQTGRPSETVASTSHSNNSAKASFRIHTSSKENDGCTRHMCALTSSGAGRADAASVLSSPRISCKDKKRTRNGETLPVEAIANAILMRLHTEPRREANQHRRSTTKSKATAKHTIGTDGTHKYFQLPWGIRPPETERSESLESHTMCPRHAHVSRD